MTKKKDHNDEQASSQDSQDAPAVEPVDLESLVKENEALFQKLQRVSADYANYQKRVPKQIADSVAYEKEHILKSLLPVLDNLDHTLNSNHTAENVAALIQGVRIIYDQMLNILALHGVEQIVAQDQVFNPSQHEAMLQRTEEDKENNIVLEEFQKGYTLNGRVIRPSKVIVNKAACIETESDAQETESTGPDDTPSDEEY